MTEEFRGVQMTDSDYESKSAALEKQIAKVSEAQSYASARTQIHYLAINERNNVREKHVANNIHPFSFHPKKELCPYTYKKFHQQFPHLPI